MKNKFKVIKGQDLQNGRKMFQILFYDRYHQNWDTYSIGYKLDYKDFKDEMKENEMFYKIEEIKTMKGNRFIISRDAEIDELYITKIEEV